MKLRELLQQMQEVQRKIGSATPFVCGGTPRDKFMGRLDNVADIDITTGDKTVDYLSQQFYEELRKKYDVTRKTMEDGHSTIFIGNLKIDFSSNFIAPNIDTYLQKLGITNPTSMQREMFSRDFTCNSLLLSIDLKQLFDPTKRGFKDIKAKKIVTCLSPEVTLTSNRNRVVRAIYLASKLGFDIDQPIIDYVRKNPQVAKISTEKATIEKLNKAFEKDPEKASRLITQMNLWPHLPITEIMQPYYSKQAVMTNKKAYFQGGGGVNEPTPGEKKYKSDPAIVVQPRFKEPFYRNYDLYTIPGMEDIGPGTGWHDLQNYKSIQDFLKDRRERLQPRYVADDSWQLDSGKRVKKNPNIETRAALFNRIIKVAGKECQDSDIVYTDSRDAYICGNCLHMSENCEAAPTPTAKELHAGKNRNPDRIDWRDGSDRENDPNYQKWKKNVSHTDENDGPNFDYGKGLYSNMDKYKSVKDFEEHADKGPGAFFADDNADHMLPPKEHGTDIYSWKNSPYQGTPKAPKCDDNDIDFPIDEEVSPIVGDSGSSYVDSVPISYQENYTAEPDQDGKGEATLDFGNDLTNEDASPGRLAPDFDEILERLTNKYLPVDEGEIYGLPDGVDSEDKDAEQTVQTENPDFGISDSGRQMYEDKWNI
jgi:hypothetical protein